MGNLFGGKTTTTSNEKFDSGPSSWQKPYLDTSFGAASDIFNQSRGTPYYQGDTYAGLDSNARDALGNLRNYANGSLQTAGQMSDFGRNMAVDGYGRFTSAMNDFTRMAGEDGTQATINAAREYANNPHVQGMIDANARDVTRNLTEEVLPGIDRAASATGNINSSRAGIAAGVARRGAEDRIGDISASIRGDAYNRGLSMAQQDRQSRLSAIGQAANMYSGLAGQGMDIMGRGMDAGYGAYDAINRSYLTEQADRQGQLDADFQRWQGQDTRAWDLLNRYNSIVGSNQWGQSGTSSSKGTQRQSGNILGQLAGMASSAASIATAVCDRRLKRNILLIGRYPDGLGIYTYTYDQDMALEYGLDLPKGYQVGPMADEVAELRPHAMGPTLNGGFASINLAAL